IGLMWAAPIYLIVLSLVPALEAVAAGSLWRRHRRPWPMMLSYVERVMPLGLTVIFVCFTVFFALALRIIGPDNWLAILQHAYWPMLVALTVMIVAQAATWRGSSLWLRLLLHTGGIALLVWAKLRLP